MPVYRAEINNVQPLTEKQYCVGGCTALIDAIGSAIHHIGNVHKYARPEDVPEHTIFVITTDGMENASHHYSSDEVKAMVERQKEKYGWEFLFLGANIDAVETAKDYGIDADRAVRFHNDRRGVALNYEVVSRTLGSMRACAPCMSREMVKDDWKEEIEADFMRRTAER